MLQLISKAGKMFSCPLVSLFMICKGCIFLTFAILGSAKPPFYIIAGGLLQRVQESQLEHSQSFKKKRGRRGEEREKRFNVVFF